MNDRIELFNLPVDSVTLIKGNYEGYDYYKLAIKLANGLEATRKLSQFEYNTLLNMNGVDSD